MRELEEDMLAFEHLSQVTLTVLSDHVDRVEGLVVEWRDDFNDVHKVRMVELLEDHDLAKDTLRIDLIIEQPSDLLDGHLTYQLRLP